MRSFLKQTSCAVVAVAIALSVSACGPSNGPEMLADNSSPGKTVTVVKSEGVSNREANARVAQARAEEQAKAAARIQCEKERQEASNKGAVVGGITGAVIGSQVAGNGAKSEGAAIGATAGVLTGRQVAKKDHRC